jgi:6-phosphogluconolactonase
MQKTILVARDEEAFFNKAAQLALETIALAVHREGRCALALSGGSTPKKLYQLLAEDYFRSRIPWTKVFFFWSDERCVPPNRDDSNYKMAYDALLSKVPVPAKNILRMPGEMEPAAEAAKAYEQTLRLFFKTHEPFPRFDLIFLGVGEDGHTASLFPGTTALLEKLKWVTANYVEKLKENRLTLTLPVINRAHRVMFLCVGSNKTSIVKEIFNENAPMRFPAQLVNPDGELVWLLDNAASAKLPPAIWNAATHV